MPKPVEENNTAVSPVSDEVLNVTDISIETVHSRSGYSWSVEGTVNRNGIHWGSIQEMTDPVQFFPHAYDLVFGTHPFRPKSRVYKPTDITKEMSKTEYLAWMLGSQLVYSLKYFSEEELTNSKTAWETLADRIGFDDVKLLGIILNTRGLFYPNPALTIQALEIMSQPNIKRFLKEMKTILNPSDVEIFLSQYLFTIQSCLRNHTSQSNNGCADESIRLELLTTYRC